jgi:hypothetical protein
MDFPKERGETPLRPSTHGGWLDFKELMGQSAGPRRAVNDKEGHSGELAESR